MPAISLPHTQGNLFARQGSQGGPTCRPTRLWLLRGILFIPMQAPGPPAAAMSLSNAEEGTERNVDIFTDNNCKTASCTALGLPVVPPWIVTSLVFARLGNTFSAEGLKQRFSGCRLSSSQLSMHRFAIAELA